VALRWIHRETRNAVSMVGAVARWNAKHLDWRWGREGARTLPAERPIFSWQNLSEFRASRLASTCARASGARSRAISRQRDVRHIAQVQQRFYGHFSSAAMREKVRPNTHLPGKGFVDLPDVDIIQRQTGSVKHPGSGICWTQQQLCKIRIGIGRSDKKTEKPD